jgi:Flp pilus assembly protein TadD
VSDGFEARYTQLVAALQAEHGRGGITPVTITNAVNYAIDANDAGRSDLTIALLEPLAPLVAGNARVWQMLALAFRQEQDMDRAATAFDQAAKVAPSDPLIANGRALTALEMGQPASALFARARTLSPEDRDIYLNQAVALDAEGKGDAARDVLQKALDTHPDWVAGHEALSALRRAAGDADYDASYARAVAACPDSLGLHLAWIRTLSRATRWDEAEQRISDCRMRLGDLPELAAVEAHIASETGAHDRVQALLEKAATLGAVTALSRIRHCLRTGRIDAAQAIAEPLMQAPGSDSIWPYLSVIWRLLDDPRAAWLDGAPPFIAHINLGLSIAELSTIADLLRVFHTAQQPFLEQSVRGGTQTDKPLFLRQEPEIRLVRDRVIDAVRMYIDALPPFVAGHPLLGTPRGNVRFEGSWSVRLRADGFHVAHTHPRGWISSAIYVDRPAEDLLGPPPAGWLQLGKPPEELGLDLPAYRELPPVAGTLAMFPSTMWHGTYPFAQGERLTMAFDVARPLR